LLVLLAGLAVTALGCEIVPDREFAALENGLTVKIVEAMRSVSRGLVDFTFELANHGSTRGTACLGPSRSVSSKVGSLSRPERDAPDLQSAGAMADIIDVQRLSTPVVVVLLASSLASAQPPIGGGPGPVLGIVEIPKMFSLDPELAGAPRGAVRIYTRPDYDSKMLVDIDWPQAIDDAEYGSEQTGALVYGRARGYFLIRTSRGVGWLSPGDAGSFHSLETLIAGDLTYLTEAWDGFVSASPGSADRRRVVPRESDVRVKRQRTVNGKLWLEIEVISHSICESTEPPTIKARGWIKAHDATGTPTVWFPSRGC
jgi:hypothetical protein